MTPTAASRLALLATCVTLAGCAGGMNLAKVEVDRSITTGSIRPVAPHANANPGPLRRKAPEGDLDQIAIRNAVTSIDLGAASMLAWENPETGSRGVITQIMETREADRPCRSFRASRHAYDGILLYEGKTCLAGRGNWQMREYKAVVPAD